MIFGARCSNGGAAKNRIAAKHQLSGFEQERIGIRVGFAGVIEVRPVLHADPRLNKALDYDLGLRGNLETRRVLLSAGTISDRTWNRRPRLRFVPLIMQMRSPS